MILLQVEPDTGLSSDIIITVAIILIVVILYFCKNRSSQIKNNQHNTFSRQNHKDEGVKSYDGHNPDISVKPTKRCPYCGELILVKAKKCKHCGEWIETGCNESKS